MIEFGQMTVESLGEEIPNEVQQLLEQFPTIKNPPKDFPQEELETTLSKLNREHKL